MCTGGSLGGPQRAPLPIAAMRLESHGSLEPQRPPHPPYRSSWASLSLPVKFRWIWRGPCMGWSRGWPPWLRPGSSSSVFPQLSGGAWVVGSPGGKSAPDSLTSGLTGAPCGLVMSCPSVGACRSNLAAAPTPTPALAARALARGWVCPGPPGTPLVPALSVCLSVGAEPSLCTPAGLLLPRGNWPGLRRARLLQISPPGSSLP